MTTYAIVYYRPEYLDNSCGDCDFEASKLSIQDNCTLEFAIRDLAALLTNERKRIIDHPSLDHTRWQYTILIDSKKATKEQAWAIEEPALQLHDKLIGEHYIEKERLAKLEHEASERRRKEFRRQEYEKLKKEFES